MRELLIKAARVLADEASGWNVENMGCYPRIRLLFEILAALGCDAEQIKQKFKAVHAAHLRRDDDAWSEARTAAKNYLNEQLSAAEVAQ